jgi:hypothetical protein
MNRLATSVQQLGAVHAGAVVEPGDGPDRKRVIVAISRPEDVEPIRSDEVRVTAYDADRRELASKQLFTEIEHLIEAHTGGATANAYFEVEVPPGRSLGEVEVALRGASARLSVPTD